MFYNLLWALPRMAFYDVTEHMAHISLQLHQFLVSLSSCQKQILQAVCAHLKWERSVNTGL